MSHRPGGLDGGSRARRSAGRHAISHHGRPLASSSDLNDGAGGLSEGSGGVFDACGSLFRDGRGRGSRRERAPSETSRHFSAVIASGNQQTPVEIRRFT